MLVVATCSVAPADTVVVDREYVAPPSELSSPRPAADVIFKVPADTVVSPV